MRRIVVLFALAMLYGCGDDSPVRPTQSAFPPPTLPGTYVTGVVADSVSTHPIELATVEWTGLAEAWGDRGNGVVTDRTGAYRIRVGPLGMILMRAAKSGYAPLEVPVTVASDTTVNFALTPEASPR